MALKIKPSKMIEKIEALAEQIKKSGLNDYDINYCQRKLDKIKGVYKWWRDIAE